MSWVGYNFEDAVIISDKLVKNHNLSSVHIEQYSTEVRDTKLGPEVLTRDIPNVSEEALSNLDGV
jgi:DNA-directed RNA polymerase subunit beta